MKKSSIYMFLHAETLFIQA